MCTPRKRYSKRRLAKRLAVMRAKKYQNNGILAYMPSHSVTKYLSTHASLLGI